MHRAEKPYVEQQLAIAHVAIWRALQACNRAVPLECHFEDLEAILSDVTLLQERMLRAKARARVVRTATLTTAI